MLSADYLTTLSNPVLDLYEEYIQSVLNDIARRLKKMGTVTSTAAWQMQRVTESGAIYENALRELAKLTGKSERELALLFKDAGVRAIKFDDSIYKQAGLDPTPLNLSPAMVEVLKVGLQKTQGLMQNLVSTTAISGQNAFIKASDMAYMQVVTGSMSYDQAIRAAIKQAASDGLSTIDYRGRVDQLDVAVRRAVLTGVNQTAGRLQDARAEEMGTDLVQTSAHAGARNRGVGPMNHASWQGKIFSRSGKHGKYPDFVTETGYGTGEGLCGWNCRHSFYPYFPGLSENAYTSNDRRQLNNKTVKVGGDKTPLYDAEQLQRNMERKVRYWKRQANALEAAGLSNDLEKAKVSEWQMKLRELVREAKLRRQYPREQV